MSKIICVATPRVKVTRRSPRPTSLFGSGILRSLPNAGRLPFSVEDEAWYVANVVAVNQENRHYDDLARESEQIERLCSGYVL